MSATGKTPIDPAIGLMALEAVKGLKPDDDYPDAFRAPLPSVQYAEDLQADRQNDPNIGPIDVKTQPLGESGHLIVVNAKSNDPKVDDIEDYAIVIDNPHAKLSFDHDSVTVMDGTGLHRLPLKNLADEEAQVSLYLPEASIPIDLKKFDSKHLVGVPKLLIKTGDPDIFISSDTAHITVQSEGNYPLNVIATPADFQKINPAEMTTLDCLSRPQQRMSISADQGLELHVRQGEVEKIVHWGKESNPIPDPRIDKLQAELQQAIIEVQKGSPPTALARKGMGR